MLNWILCLYAALMVHLRAAARQVWGELPGHLTAAVVIEAVITGDSTWMACAAFLLVTLTILRR